MTYFWFTLLLLAKTGVLASTLKDVDVSPIPQGKNPDELLNYEEDDSGPASMNYSMDGIEGTRNQHFCENVLRCGLFQAVAFMASLRATTRDLYRGLILDFQPDFLVGISSDPNDARKITIKEKGIYSFTWTLYHSHGTRVCTELMVNDVVRARAHGVNILVDDVKSTTETALVKVYQDNKVYIRISRTKDCGPGGTILHDAYRNSVFYGFKIGDFEN